ncbi:hypothetical protein QQZ08_010314 [Neonectria magnoliae]|uniref:Uncharacterized protein n=1 Tax=Neonectria magnoliae TaxID=2732573 RepID=A0ABR1HI16_9HYPO
MVEAPHCVLLGHLSCTALASEADACKLRSNAVSGRAGESSSNYRRHTRQSSNVVSMRAGGYPTLQSRNVVPGRAGESSNVNRRATRQNSNAISMRAGESNNANRHPTRQSSNANRHPTLQNRNANNVPSLGSNIILRRVPPYGHEQASSIERSHRAVLDKARAAMEPRPGIPDVEIEGQGSRWGDDVLIPRPGPEVNQRRSQQS